MPTVRQSILDSIQQLQDNQATADTLSQTHQPEQPNPVPNIVDAFKAFGTQGLQGLANQQGWQTPEWSQKLGATLSSPEANAAFNFNPALGALKMKLESAGGNAKNFNLHHADTDEHVGYLTTYQTPENKNIVYADALDSLLPSKYPKGSIPYEANRRSGSLGFENIRSLLPQIAEHYPESTWLHAVRTSGARDLSGGYGILGKIRLRPDKP